MRRTLAFALVVPALLLPLAGCGSEGKVPTPPPCLAAPAAWTGALKSAPDQVLLHRVTPISLCLPKDQSPAQQEEVGRVAVEVATRLSAKSKSGSASAGASSALMAGYLVGALEKGADETEGIHSTLVDRVEAAATNGLDGRDQEIQAAYQRGYEAGLKSG